MRTSSPIEHEAFAKLTHHLVLAIDALQEVARLRPDQPWMAIVDGMNLMKEKILRIAEAGLRSN